MINNLSFTEVIKKKGKQVLKKNNQYILYKTKEGYIYREKIVENGIIQELIEKNNFIPIEGANDSEIIKITETGIFLGSQDAAYNLKDLIYYNIKCILNVATKIPNFYPEKFIYYNIEILDLDEEPIISLFPKCFEIIDFCLKNNFNILIHCNAGISRSPTIVIGYLMYSQKISFQKAFNLVKEKRSKIQPNPGFIQQLKLYEKNLLNSI